MDLYGGNNATSADQARALMSKVDAAQAQQTLQSWVGYLQAYGAEMIVEKSDHGTITQELIFE